jgi:hypothetical protein
MDLLEEAQAELARSRELARASGNLQLEAWSWAISCNYHRANDLRVAANDLRRARRCVERFGRELFALQARMSFEEAELLRARRRWHSCQHTGDDLAAALDARPTQRIPYGGASRGAPRRAGA